MFVSRCFSLIVQFFLQINKQIREADTQEREKSKLLIGSKSPRNGPNVEQRNYCNKVCIFFLLSHYKLSDISPNSCNRIYIHQSKTRLFKQMKLEANLNSVHVQYFYIINNVKSMSTIIVPTDKRFKREAK